jgi:biopolymer transport protein ExbD
MRIRRASESATELINISSLLDVMFILIIFFMATTTFRQEERDITINLPETGESHSLSSAPKVIVVNVRKDGSYLVGDQPTTLPELSDVIAAAIQSDPGQKVLVRGDEQALHGRVALAVAACKQAGVQEAKIGYDLNARAGLP